MEKFLKKKAYFLFVNKKNMLDLGKTRHGFILKSFFFFDLIC
jgi:hypothetical protein